jgi:hypothetical protein
MKYGFNDYVGQINISGKILRSYQIWRNMLYRCYDVKYKTKYPTYKEVTCCSDWLYFSKFKHWYDSNYPNIPNTVFHLDKDILHKNNKLYSPENCCFVPDRINYLLLRCEQNIGKNLPGVFYRNDVNLYASRINILDEHNNKNKKLHLGYFSNEHDAFVCYKNKKEEHVRHVAETYFELGLISENVYAALKSWELKL